MSFIRSPCKLMLSKIKFCICLIFVERESTHISHHTKTNIYPRKNKIMRHLEDIVAEVNQSLKVCLVFECIKESDNY